MNAATPVRQDKRLWLVLAVLAAFFALKLRGVTWAADELSFLAVMVGWYVTQSQAGLTLRSRQPGRPAGEPPPGRPST